jgi:hypothetical protein
MTKYLEEVQSSSNGKCGGVAAFTSYNLITILNSANKVIERWKRLASSSKMFSAFKKSLVSGILPIEDNTEITL